MCQDIAAAFEILGKPAGNMEKLPRFSGGYPAYCVLLILLGGAAAGQPSPIKVKNPGASSEFANIQLTALSPNTVEIDWIPLNGAEEYRVYRNATQIGPTYPSVATATEKMTVYDYNAPAGSSLKYYVTAARKTTIIGTPGTPDAGKQFTVEMLMQTSSTVTVVTPAGPPVVPPIQGFVDMHTHPLSYLGFGGKLIYGAVDAGSTLPPGCNDGTASSEYDALGREYLSYGSSDHPCGDDLRAVVIPKLEAKLGSVVYPTASLFTSGPQSLVDATALDFPTWPAWNDVLRQKMWVEWIRRAYAGGLRVMVALAVNSKLLADITAGQGDLASDDLTTTDNQIKEIKAFVGRHADFMQVALTAAELHSAVANNKLAVVIGMEIDNIGNFVGNVPAAALNAEIDRLYTEGVRYIFPVHLVDNPIGGTAVYQDLFNVANVYEEQGASWDLACKQGITYNYTSPDSLIQVGAFAKLGTKTPSLPPSKLCPAGFGSVNTKGLSDSGNAALQHMMDRGMLIDVDHMSELAVNDAIKVAESNFPVPYPLNSGHNVVRGALGIFFTERALTPDQYASIGFLHGMAGIGSSKGTSIQWLQLAQQTLAAMQVQPNVPALAFGTDADGLEFMMPPRCDGKPNLSPGWPAPPPPCLSQPSTIQPGSADFPLPPATDQKKSWDYNIDGVAHYGLLPDFLQDVKSLTPGGSAMFTLMNNGAQYFYDTWLLAQRDAVKTCSKLEKYNAQAKVCVPFIVKKP